MKDIKIGDRIVGDGYPVFIIAEAGANWKYCNDDRNNRKRAYELIDIASDAGADAVKFQVYRADRLYVRSAGRADYIGEEKSIYDIIKEMELPYEWLGGLKEYCDKKGILFLATPFDEESARILYDLGVEANKIASYTISHVPLLKQVASYGKPVIFSTGASDMADIDTAVNSIREAGCDEIAVMQCTARYPAPLDTVNLKVIPNLKERYNIPIGFSDHSREPYIAPLGAVALGANIIEKHFTVSNDLEGPDHGFAVLPDELKVLVDGVRGMERAIGKGEKNVTVAERELYDFCRRKIYAAKDIEKGKKISEDDLSILRSGNFEKGLDPSDIYKLIGKKAKRHIKKEEPLNWDVVE